MCVLEYILSSANMAYVIEDWVILIYSANMKYITYKVFYNQQNLKCEFAYAWELISGPICSYVHFSCWSHKVVLIQSLRCLRNDFVDYNIVFGVCYYWILKPNSSL